MLENEVALDTGSLRTEISGVNIELWSGGEGRPVLFLHPGDGFDPAAPFVAGLARRSRVIAPSHPGFGGSDLPTGFGTVDDLSYFYLDLMRSLGLEDTVLVGVSFGAWIAAEIAVKCSRRVAGVVLADTLGARFSPPTTREIADLFSIAPFDIPRLVYREPEKHRRNYAPMSDADLLRHARNYESFGLFGWAPTLHNPKLRQRLRLIDVPTLVLWGSDDRVVSPDHGRSWAAAIPGASFKLIADAGHYVHMDAPDQFVSAVGDFVDGIGTSR